MKNLWMKFRNYLKVGLGTRDAMVYLLLLALVMVIFAGCTAYAAPAAVVAVPWYAAINWTQIIVTVLGGGGLFAIVKYVLDYRSGVKKVKVDSTKEDNRQEEAYVEQANKLRDEYRILLGEVREEVAMLRKRISLLEITLTENNIPLPYVKDMAVHT